MKQFDVEDFVKQVLDGQVQPLTFESVEPAETPNAYKITLRLDPSQIAHLPESIRKMLEPQIKEPLIIILVWDEARKKATLTIQTVRIPNAPGNREKALEAANGHNQNVGHISKMAILDRGTHMDAGLSVTQHLPLPEHPDIAKQILHSVIMQLTMEAGNAATLLIGGARDPNTPIH